ncbi:MAG: 23S rRNA (adenine(2503)-C(2))-methyltransferase RlmN [Acidobacteria bacterium]|nr:MAG: 23S rRNA (adenine(2503)-C(2))-methyltransferase RlmN [Acidobacteriota bacterium]REJ98704.1 MAG: 23S rRNA (adenine(2503)-C(2))-methyltransferase RlmN [Acidobacteriota bacterium]REK16641.1 MAG: 23S rRNA (adenine(2503)-C(2))-methyltransferase RlmN [Acidobacteriota bacterium]REK42552.1 MAG: 23S rRNA (adenine(2503)-C(2))-methyltransferase RlmN [Acidobacteriota bacterium]
MEEKRHLTGLTRTELAQLAAELGEPSYRADQLISGIRGRRLRDLEQITDLPKAFRARLSEVAVVEALTVASKYVSQDGTRRYLMENRSGNPIETVFIPTENRDTICFSSQSGCPLKCDFCLTAKLGLLGNLTPGEIVEQIIIVLNDVYGEANETPHGTNLVAMGAGEPFLNFDNLLKAVEILAEEKGLHIVPRRITVSTAGIVPRIRDFAALETRPNLAISLSAPNDELRDRLMPVNRKWNIDELLSAAREFQSSLKRGENFTFEYVLLAGVNDSLESAHELASLLKRHGLQKAKVNLIAHNAADPLPYGPPSVEAVAAFKTELEKEGIPAYVRTPRGRDIFAACGQLAAKKEAAVTTS